MGFFRKNKNNWTLGELKNLDDISLDDMKNYPIWINDLSGEWENGFDESSERPLIGANDITDDILSEFVSISVLVKFPDQNEFGSANLEDDGSVSCIAVWRNNEWVIGSKAFQEQSDIELSVIPSIIGEEDVTYIYDPKSDIGNKK